MNAKEKSVAIRGIRNTRIQILAFAVGFLITCYFWFPVVLNNQILAYGGGDVFHNIWAYKRNIAFFKNLEISYLGQFQFPEVNSSLWSEFQMVDSLVYGIIKLFQHSDLTAYALLLFITALVNFCSAYYISIQILNANVLFALPVCIWFANNAYRFEHLGHQQAQTLVYILSPIAILHFTEKLRNRGKKGINLLVVLAALLFANNYFGPSYNQFASISFTMFLILFFMLIVKKPQKKIIVKNLTKVLTKRTFVFTSLPLFLLAMPINARYLKEGLIDGKVRSVVEQNSYRVDLLSLFAFPNSNRLGSKFPLSADNLNFIYAPSFLPIGLGMLIILALIVLNQKPYSRNKISLLLAGLCTFSISLGSNIVFGKKEFLVNPIFEILSRIGILGSFRYLPQLGFLGLFFAFLALTSETKNLNRFLPKKSLAALTLLAVSITTIEQYPNYSRMQNKVNYDQSSFDSLTKTLQNHEQKTVGFYPSMQIPMNNSDPLVFEEFMRMAGVASANNRFIGGITGFSSPEAMSMSAELMYRDDATLNGLIENFVTASKILVIDETLLKNSNSERQVDIMLEMAKAKGLQVERSSERFVVISSTRNEN